MEGILNLEENNIGFYDFYSNKLSKTDVKFILDDFEKNGIIAFKKVNFDFAIVFFLKGRFYLSRDFFGNVPLFYFIRGKKVHYSVSIKVLIESPYYKKEINLNEIDYYFNNYNTTKGYNDQTFWANIYSAIPGQLLSFDIDFNKTYENYFKLIKKTNNPTNIFLTFKEIFKSSIEKNILKDDIISSSLSGGIDSSSITSLLSSIMVEKITSIELRTSFEIGSERDFAQDVVNKWNTNHFIISKYPDFYQSEKLNCQITGLPSFSLITASRQIGIIEILKSQNSNKILLGEGGDQILGLHREYFDELILNSKFLELKYELSNILGYKGNSKNELHKIPYAKSFLKSTLKRLVIQKSLVKILWFLFRFYNLKIITDYSISFFKKNKKSDKTDSLLPNLLIKSGNNLKNYSINHLDLIKKDNTENFDYLKNIFSRESIKLKEQNFLFGLKYGINYIYPFYDINILNFISSSDKKVNFGNGIGRNIIRQSMKGILPDSIINRKTKTYFSPFLHQVFWDFQSESNINFSKDHKLWNFINYNTFQEIETIVKNTNYFDAANFGIKNTYLITCLKVYYLGIWLDVYFE